MYMVTKCVKSFKYVNMYVVTCNRVQKDFFTDEAVPGKERTILSTVEVTLGEHDLEFSTNKEKTKFWISGIKEDK